MKQYNAIWMINIDEDCTFMVLTNCSCHTILVRCKYEHVFKCSSLCNCTAQFYAILKAVILCALDLNPQNTARFTNIGKV